MKVVAVMTRGPVDRTAAGVEPHETTGGPKTRLAAVLPDPASREVLQRAMLADVLTAARGVAGAIVRLAATPPCQTDAFVDLGIPAGQLMLQRGDTLAERERALLQDLFRRGARQVLVVGSDLPLLTSSILSQAFDALEADPTQVVLGPASDGGYYLLGLSGPTVPDLFTGVRFSTKYALMDTWRRCEFAERRVATLPLIDDVDEPGDLVRLREALRAEPALAPHTAAALALLFTTLA